MSWQDELREKIDAAGWDKSKCFDPVNETTYPYRSKSALVAIGVMPFQAAGQLISRVNDREVKGYPPQTLRIIGLSTREESAEMTVEYREEPWNNSLHADGQFKPLAEPVFPAIDFDLIPSRRRTGLL